MVGILLSYWVGRPIFRGELLVSGRVNSKCHVIQMCLAESWRSTEIHSSNNKLGHEKKRSIEQWTKNNLCILFLLFWFKFWILQKTTILFWDLFILGLTKKTTFVFWDTVYAWRPVCYSLLYFNYNWNCHIMKMCGTWIIHISSNKMLIDFVSCLNGGAVGFQNGYVKPQGFRCKGITFAENESTTNT